MRRKKTQYYYIFSYIFLFENTLSQEFLLHNTNSPLLLFDTINLTDERKEVKEIKTDNNIKWCVKRDRRTVDFSIRMFYFSDY